MSKFSYFREEYMYLQNIFPSVMVNNGQLWNKAESNTIFTLSNAVSLVPVMNLPQLQAKLYYIFSVSAFGHALTQTIRHALHTKALFITPYFFFHILTYRSQCNTWAHTKINRKYSVIKVFSRSQNQPRLPRIN